MKIPLSAPDITEPEIAAVAAVLRSPHLSLGPKLAEFETAISLYTGVPHAIAVSSGTAGLHLALLALGITQGDEVLVPSFTFIAAANAIRYVGATPVFVDIDPESLNLSPAAVEQAITPRTRAILAVHTFGRPADMHALLALARRHHLFLVEDACEAIGAQYHNQPAGSFGDLAVFAFYPNKQITTGEGGIVLTPRPDLAARIRSLRNQGRPEASSNSTNWFQHEKLGYNYRLADIACTLGITQLARLPEILARREHIARLYHQHLAPNPNLVLPTLDVPNLSISWFVYVIRLAPHLTSTDRDRIVHHLQQSGISCGRYFAPIHLQPAYAGHPHSPLPITESEAARTLALPFFNRITEAQIAEVCDTLQTALASLPADPVHSGIHA
ncbi:DegT/DnrJ/EryC1/StrS family aminotransferase [Tunturiibacter empetritectus]|uniref:Perosamine synthetase n=1 Tax=Tunturiibacter lichenicola TaxID=2051959 RepID=A0A852VE44_9BACT|nr:DegT/DnrJ/EryC1/StrS family aminotransferase [Edaphobacter lichenicola]NYF88724.1 perosamine synthetase [Edaphobacter lichenicola]